MNNTLTMNEINGDKNLTSKCSTFCVYKRITRRRNSSKELIPFQEFGQNNRQISSFEPGNELYNKSFVSVDEFIQDRNLFFYVLLVIGCPQLRNLMQSILQEVNTYPLKTFSKNDIVHLIQLIRNCKYKILKHNFPRQKSLK